jgi:ATP-dependent helicase/nuclease subunit A
VLALEWGERRLANVHKLLRLARRFEAGEGRDLRAFLDRVDYLASSARVEPDAPVEGVEPDAVRLMTVHAAKGLEFAVVCVADLGRQPSSRMPDLLVDGDRVGLRLMRLDGAASAPALAYEQLCAERRAREAEEEDRIAYVAMTRARELLLLSGAVKFERWPRPGPGAAPISWLGPALSQELPALAAERAGATYRLAPVPGADARVLCRLSSPAAPLFSAGGGAIAGARTGDAAAGSTAVAEIVRSPDSAGSSETVAAKPPSSQQPIAEAVVPTSEREQLRALSYSSLTELERCGYRYYLERVLSLPEDRAAARTAGAPSGLEARARGTLVHRLMELHDFAAALAPTEQDVQACARELGLSVGARERDELAALIGAAVAAAPAARVAAAPSVRREHPFAFALGAHEPLINGVIDLLAAEADGTRLVLDYKSDRVGPDADLEELVAREYAIQRLLYALAVLREGATEVEIVHWFLEREEWVSARYRAADRLTLEERLARRIERARELRFAVSDTPHRGLCLTCPGRTGLCSWGERETLRELP